MGKPGMNESGTPYPALHGLRGFERGHYLLTATLCGIDLLCLSATWLPSRSLVPKPLVLGLFLAVFPVFIVGLFRLIAARVKANQVRSSFELPRVPRPLRAAYALAIALIALGIATGSAHQADLKETERVLAAFPAPFYTITSALILTTATTTRRL
ncbi:hypothetical protein AB0K51_21375 [Kitasatospora sp. NPDC049285]|uniref:hypothetical protein n=1 Tax=Kitasatospora sp. NPDC049285 TaxID=3157096 RepID=UPI0034336B4F